MTRVRLARSPFALLHRGPLVLAALAPLLILLAVMRSGPGITVDGAEYLQVAKSFSAHGSLSMPYQSWDEPFQVPVHLRPDVPLSIFPPAWPTALGLSAAATRTDPLRVARVLDIVFIAAITCLVGAVVLRNTRSRLSAAIAMLLMGLPELLIAHAQVWSEPLLLVGMGITLLALHRRLLGDIRMRWLVVAMCGIAISVSTRYAGLGIALGAVVAVIVPRTPALRHRLRAAALLATAAAVPAAAWSFRNLTAIGRPSERAVGWHPPRWAEVRQGFDVMATWFVGWSNVRGLMFGLLLAVLAMCGVRAWRAGRLREPTIGLLAGAIAVSYLLVVFVARTVLDANVPMDGRVLLPVFPLMIVGILGSRPESSRPRRAIFALALAVLAGFVARDASLIAQFPDGQVSGYTSARWEASPTLDYLRRLPDTTVIVTDAPDAIHLYLDHRLTLFIPLRSDLYTGGRNHNYARQVASVAAAIRGRRAVIAFFSRPTRGRFRRVAPGLADALQMVRSRTFKDGTVFQPVQSGA